MPESSHLRQNGSQAACDPCRARKVACDHNRPACSRCQSKNRTAECVYSATAARKSKASNIPRPPADDGYVTTLTPHAPKRHRPNMRLGYTSSLEETQPSLRSTTHSSPYGSLQHHDPGHQERDVVFHHLSPAIRETCLAVLRALPGQLNEQMVYLDGDVAAKGWAHLAVHKIIKWLRSMLDESFSRGEQETMERVARIICSNTAKPLRGPFSDWESWLNSFVGENTRWESIGLLWVHMERVSDILDALIPRKLVRSPNNSSANTATLHLDYCIQLTRHFTEESHLLADLYRRQSTLESLTNGESGELVSTPPTGLSGYLHEDES